MAKVSTNSSSLNIFFKEQIRVIIFEMPSTNSIVKSSVTLVSSKFDILVQTSGSAMEMKTKLGADGMTEIPMSPPPTDPRAPDVHAVEAIADPTEKPADGSKLEMVQWVLAFPLKLLMKITIPGGIINLQGDPSGCGNLLLTS